MDHLAAEVEAARQVLFKAHAIVSVAAAAAVSEFPADPLFMRHALHMAEDWLMDVINELDEAVARHWRRSRRADD
jgi:hypothetical protein